MNLFKKISLAFAALTLLGSTVAQADPSNFSYTTLSVGLGKEHLKDPVCIIPSECHNDLGLINLGGAYQFADDWLVVSLDIQGTGSSKPNTTLSGGASNLGLSVVKAIGEHIDVLAKVSALSYTNESCWGSLCTKVDDTGNMFTAGINAWFDSGKSFAGYLRANSIKYSKSSQSITQTEFGASYYFNRSHELGLNFGVTDNDTQSSLRYAYHF